MKRLVACFSLVVLLLLPGCVYSNIIIPLDTDLQDTTLGDKTGRAYNQSVMWLISWGDAGTQAAAENGGITTLRHADQEVLIVLFGLYSKVTTIVYGS